jgi:hypothetical protein
VGRELQRYYFGGTLWATYIEDLWIRAIILLRQKSFFLNCIKAIFTIHLIILKRLTKISTLFSEKSGYLRYIFLR